MFERHPPKEALVFFQLFYPFPTTTMHEFEMKYKEAIFLNVSEAHLLIKGRIGVNWIWPNEDERYKKY